MVNNKRISAKIMMFLLALAMGNLCIAQQSGYTVSGVGEVEENPSALAMTGDLLIVRPVMFTMTVVGAALWLVSLPFSAAGGNAKQAGKTLVATPATHTFMRCLGCTQPGYKQDVEAAAQ